MWIKKYKEYFVCLKDTVSEEFVEIRMEKGYKGRLYIPSESKKGGAVPLVVAFHGAGSRGRENRLQIRKNVSVTNVWLQHQKKHSCYVFAPQCHLNERWIETDWDKGNYDIDLVKPSKAFLAAQGAIHDIMENYNVDKNRIYIVGNSMGGFATWYYLMTNPELFAGALPICGGACVSDITKCKTIPIWTCHGANDKEVPVVATREIVKCLKECGGNIVYTEYENGTHNVWDKFLSEGALDNGMSVIDWLFSQRKSVE
jgi:predicted peptidase